MAQRLKNVLSFANLAPGAVVVLPHRLQTSAPRPLAPDIIYIPSPDLEVESDEINVTLLNNGNSAISGSVLVEAWHTIERSFEDVNDEDLQVKPYVVVGGVPSQSEVIYLAATNLSKQIRDAGCGSNPPVGALVDPTGLLINPVFGTPDGISVVEVNDNGNACLVMQPQTEGLMPVVPFRDPGNALVYDAEAHHFATDEKKTRLIAFGIINSFAYVYDISCENRLYPKLIASVDLSASGYTGPHDAVELDDGTFLVAMSGQAALKPLVCPAPGAPVEGLGPGGLIRITRDGAFINDVTQPVDHTMFTSAAISIAINENKLLAYPQFQTHYYFDQAIGIPCEVGDSVVLFNFDPAAPGVITSALQTVPLSDTAGNVGFNSTSPTFWPGTLKGADGRDKEVLFATAITAGLFALVRNAGSNGPFVAQLIIKLPVGNAYPAHAAMHAITFTRGDTEEVKYNKLYLTDTWGNAIWQMDMSNGLPPVGQYFSETPGSKYFVQKISDPNIHWAEFNRKGNRIYTSNTLFSLFDWILCKYPPDLNPNPTAISRHLRGYAVDSVSGDVATTPDLELEAPKGYGFVKFELRNRARHPGYQE